MRLFRANFHAESEGGLDWHCKYTPICGDPSAAPLIHMAKGNVVVGAKLVPARWALKSALSDPTRISSAIPAQLAQGLLIRR